MGFGNAESLFLLVSLLSRYGKIYVSLHARIYSPEPNLPEPESPLL